MADRPPAVNCPLCGKPAEWSPANPYRPFCSERCKRLDLGAWASGEYRIAGAADESEPGAADGGDALGAGGQG